MRPGGLTVEKPTGVINVIEGEAGSGELCVNGAAAHLVKPGDVVIIASWTDVARRTAVRNLATY